MRLDNRRAPCRCRATQSGPEKSTALDYGPDRPGQQGIGNRRQEDCIVGVWNLFRSARIAFSQHTSAENWFLTPSRSQFAWT